MKNLTVARRYAKALYELAHETNSFEDVLQSMNNLRHAFLSTPELGKILANSLIQIDEKERLMRVVTSNKLVLKFMALLAKKKRLDLFAPVYDHLQLLCDSAKGIHRAVIKTAMALTEAQKKIVESDLAKAIGGKIIGQFEVAKDLIGGVWIKMGDKVLDITLKRRIDDFRFALQHSAN